MIAWGQGRLRPLEAKDLEQVLVWRNSDRIRPFMYSDRIISMEEHRAWFERNEETQVMKAYVFDWNGAAAGVMNYNKFDKGNGIAHWGFYLGSEVLPPGCGTLLGFLGMSLAFEHLSIRKLCGEVLGFNEASLRFHRKLGFAEEGCLRKHVQKQNVYHDIVQFASFAEEWPIMKQQVLARIPDRGA